MVLKGAFSLKHANIKHPTLCKETFLYELFFFYVQNVYTFLKICMDTLHRLKTRKTRLEIPTKPGTQRKTRIVAIFGAFLVNF